MKRIWKICSRGHKFQKSSNCPVCPICWPGYYKKQLQSDFPKGLSAPAIRALFNAKIKKLSQLTKFTQSDLLKLHGMGPSSIPKLQRALKLKKLTFKK